MVQFLPPNLMYIFFYMVGKTLYLLKLNFVPELAFKFSSVFLSFASFSINFNQIPSKVFYRWDDIESVIQKNVKL